MANIPALRALVTEIAVGIHKLCEQSAKGGTALHKNYLVVLVHPLPTLVNVAYVYWYERF